MYLGEQFDLMAGAEKDLESCFGQRLRFAVRVAGVLQGVKQNAPAQLAEAMLEHRLGVEQTAADRPQMLDRHCPQARRMQGQPIAQGGFGILHHRSDVPQGVVEVEGDQFNAHSEPPLRLARGWAWS